MVKKSLTIKKLSNIKEPLNFLNKTSQTTLKKVNRSKSPAHKNKAKPSSNNLNYP